MKAPSFYCENCGREVNSNLDICPGCGEKFISVRCPSCGFTGNVELFNKNCPCCGYIGDIKEKISQVTTPIYQNLSDKHFIQERNFVKLLSSRVYKLIILSMIGIIIILVRIYIKL